MRSTWANEQAESTRLAVALAVIGGDAFRHEVMERAKDRVRATSPELGLDFELILQVALWMDLRALRYELLYAVLFIPTSVAWFSAPGVALVLTLLLAAIYAYERYEANFVLARDLKRGQFSIEDTRKKFEIAIPEELRASVPLPNQNVLVYSGFVPFESAGLQLGGWSLVVDTTRPKAHNHAPVLPVNVADLMQRIESGLLDIQPGAVSSRDYVVLHGTDARDVPAVLPDPRFAPRQHVSSEAVNHSSIARGERARIYKWFTFSDWGDDLLASVVFYCKRVGDSVYIESKRYLLTPVAEKFRSIDQLPNRRLGILMERAIGYMLLALIAVPWSVLCLVMRANRGLEEVFGAHERHVHRELQDKPRFNYGSAYALRARMAGQVFQHYFQKTDYEMRTKLVDKRTLDLIVDFLDEHGVDTSDLRERQAVIMNSGIIVHGGDVKADSLAVGTGAQASGIFARRHGANAQTPTASGGAS